MSLLDSPGFPATRLYCFLTRQQAEEMKTPLDPNTAYTSPSLVASVFTVGAISYMHAWHLFIVPLLLECSACMWVPTDTLAVQQLNLLKPFTLKNSFPEPHQPLAFFSLYHSDSQA